MSNIYGQLTWIVTLLIFLFLSACGSGDSDSVVTADDTLAPVITLNGDATISHYWGRDYVDAGATAVDDVDGEVNVTVSGEVNTEVAGDYTLIYTAIDSSNNSSQLTRLVTVMAQRPFITTWDTRIQGFSLYNQIEITTSGEGFDYSVDWGDDTVEHNMTGNVRHSYESPGIYTIKITGDFPHLYMRPLGYSYEFDAELFYSDNDKLLSVEQWGDIKWRSMHAAFREVSNLAIMAQDMPNLSQVTDMSYMFYGAEHFNQSIGAWDVSNVTNMSYMFYSVRYFNQEIGVWDVSNVTDMSYMFHGANQFNKNIADWDVSSVTNMEHMFTFAGNFNQDISHWNVSGVVNMRLMFYRAELFNQDIGHWDVSSVIDMTGMFSEAILFNQDLSAWDVSNVTSMGSFFDNVTLSSDNYDALLLGWANLELQKDIFFNAGNSQYSEKSAAARQHIIDYFEWTIKDNGQIN